MFNFTIYAVIVNSSFNFTLHKDLRAASKKSIPQTHVKIKTVLFSRIIRLQIVSKVWIYYFFVTCWTAYAPSISLCTAIRCHWTGFGVFWSFMTLRSNIPPVPTVNIVIVLPFRSIFCTGACPTFPQIIACKKYIILCLPLQGNRKDE